MKDFLTFLIFIFLINPGSYCQNLSTEGDDFWVAFMENWLQDPNNPMHLEIYISADDSTTGVLEMPGMENSLPPVDFTIVPGRSLIIPIPTDLAMMAGTDQVQNKGIHIKTKKDVSVYAMNKRQYSADMTVVLPTYTLGNDYYVMSHWEDDNRDNNAHSDSEFVILAVEDNTQIKIVPSVNTLGGHDAGEPYYITINKGQAYQVQASAELTGTRVSAVLNSADECKHFAVFAGNKYTKVGHCDSPDGHDHLYNQMYPIDTWGKEYISVSLLNRTGGDYIKILAGYDHTMIKINGEPVMKGTNDYFDAGEYFVILIDGVNSISADKPVSVGQFSRSQACDDSRGDPFMLILNPNEQVLQKITFYAPEIATLVNFDLSIVTKTTDAGNVILDGNSIANDFYPVPANPDYSYARVLITQGNHTIASKEGIIAYVYGFGSNESFGYATGAGLENINLQILVKSENGQILPADSICHGIPFLLFPKSDYEYNQYTWSLGDGTSVTTSQPDSIPHIFENAGKYIIYLNVKSGNAGCVGSQNQSVQVIKVLNPQLTIVGPRSVCPNTNNVNYWIKEKSTNLVSWTSVGGSITTDTHQDSILVNWGDTNPEAFLTLEAINTRGCTGDPTQKVIKIKDQLEPDAPLGEDTLCSDEMKDLSYMAYNLPGTFYLWQATPGTLLVSDSSNEVSISWNSAGVNQLWYFQQSIKDTICAGLSDTITVLIKRKPLDYLKLYADQDSYGIGEPVGLSAKTDTLFSIINWDFGNGTHLDSQAINIKPGIKYNCAGTYEVNATAIDTSGICQANASDGIQIKINGPDLELINVTHENFVNDRLYIYRILPDNYYVKPIYLYKYDYQSGWYPFDTLYNPKSQVTDSIVQTRINQYYYLLKSNGDCPDSLATPAHSNLVLRTGKDKKNIDLDWNDYINWKHGVLGYEVWFKLDDQPFMKLTTLNDLSYEDTVRNDGFEHCFAIKALENGGNQSYSWSNVSCITLAPELYPYNVITPNGDGKNETFIIKNIEYYPNSVLTVFNRWGRRIIQFKGYHNDWGGMINGEILPNSTYFYEINLNDKRSEKKTINGMLTVLR